MAAGLIVPPFAAGITCEGSKTGRFSSEHPNESNTGKSHGDVCTAEDTEKFQPGKAIHAGSYFPPAPGIGSPSITHRLSQRCANGVVVENGVPYMYALQRVREGEPPVGRFLYGVRSFCIRQAVVYESAMKRFADFAYNAMFLRGVQETLPGGPALVSTMACYGMADVLPPYHPTYQSLPPGQQWTFGCPYIPEWYHISTVHNNPAFEVPRVSFTIEPNWVLTLRTSEGPIECLGLQPYAPDSDVLLYGPQGVIDTVHFQVGQPPIFTYLDVEKIIHDGIESQSDAEACWRPYRQPDPEPGKGDEGEEASPADGPGESQA